MEKVRGVKGQISLLPAVEPIKPQKNTKIRLVELDTIIFGSNLVKAKFIRINR